MASEDLSITLVNTASGQSETLPIPPTMAVKDVADLAQALFGMTRTAVLYKDGKALNPTITLQRAGIQNGDLIAAQLQPQPAAPAASGGGGGLLGGLDFSSLLGGGSGSSTAAAAAPSSSGASPRSGGSSKPGPPVYYPGMSVEDAMQYNPHPHNFISLLQSHDHLFKEFRYHQPQLAAKLQNQPLETAVQIWREEMVKGGIAAALKQTQHFHKKQEMERRLAANPNDETAKAYFSEQDRKRQVDQQYMQMMEQYPESMGRVLMLYVEAKINGHAIQAFCDSGAQTTIMSRKVAAQCGLDGLIDTRFAGVAAGVGTGKILGRIHIVQLQIGQAYYPCSVSVMDDPAPGATEMPFLLGLDMMKRHLVQLDLRKGVLRFTAGAGGPEEIPFLHEKDLDTSQGGTKGFDAEKANEELRKLQEKADTADDEDDDEKKKTDSGDADMSSP